MQSQLSPMSSNATTSSRTIGALYNTSSDAERARGALLSAGIDSSDIHVVDASRTNSPGSTQAATPTTGSAASHAGFFGSVKHLFMPEAETRTYAEGVRQGGTFLAVTTTEEDCDQVIQILESSNPMDLEQSEKDWFPAGSSALASASGSALSGTANDKLEVMEENIKVGRRDVDRGSVRIRSYVVEQPFSEQVTLREEHVGIDRRVVDRPLDATDSFTDKTIELEEMGEEAVVQKTARVKEEISLRKDVGQRSETISDTVRHTEVEIDDGRTGVSGTKTSGTTSSTTTTKR